MPYVAQPVGSTPSGCPSRAPDCGDLAAEDAVRALLDVSAESLAGLARELRSVAVLVDVAAVDYARTEARLSGGAPE